VWGSLDGEVEYFPVPEPKLVVERHGAAGKLSGHRDRKADGVALHGRMHHGERGAVFPAGLRDPGANGVPARVVMVLVVHRGIGGETIGGDEGIEPIGGGKVTRHGGRQGGGGRFHGRALGGWRDGTGEGWFILIGSNTPKLASAWIGCGSVLARDCRDQGRSHIKPGKTVLIKCLGACPEDIYLRCPGVASSVEVRSVRAARMRVAAIMGVAGLGVVAG
jgi:hypothetical protein